MSSAPCPLPRVMKDKITEDQARDLAQKFADKNWAGFKVEKPLGYSGGYNTMCYQTASAPAARSVILYSVEYSMDLKNPAGETRNLCVDQFGTVSEFCSGSPAMAGATGPAGPMGPAGAQGPAGSVGPQAMATPAAGAINKSFKDILFDFDKSDIRANETNKITDVAAYIKQNPTFQVGINGYADPRGTEQYNQGLSERRVNAIRDALVKAGVASNKITSGAFGEQKPLCSESTETCWQSDRRVDVGFRTETASR
jgi:outer membrane protein OmpA-like peptidoglycan-associated protein